MEEVLKYKILCNFLFTGITIERKFKMLPTNSLGYEFIPIPYNLIYPLQAGIRQRFLSTSFVIYMIMALLGVTHFFLNHVIQH